MQIFLTRRTDAEYVDLIRRTHERVNRWKWAMILMYLGFLVGTLFVAYSGIKFTDHLFKPAPFPKPTFEIGWTMGSITGFFFAFGFWGIGVAIPTILVELRTWKLLLAYHDRLREAGLLPAEASGKIEVEQQAREG